MTKIDHFPLHPRSLNGFFYSHLLPQHLCVWFWISLNFIWSTFLLWWCFEISRETFMPLAISQEGFTRSEKRIHSHTFFAILCSYISMFIASAWNKFLYSDLGFELSFFFEFAFLLVCKVFFSLEAKHIFCECASRCLVDIIWNLLFMDLCGERELWLGIHSRHIRLWRRWARNVKGVKFSMRFSASPRRLPHFFDCLQPPSRNSATNWLPLPNEVTNFIFRRDDGTKKGEEEKFSSRGFRRISTLSRQTRGCCKFLPLSFLMETRRRRRKEIKKLYQFFKANHSNGILLPIESVSQLLVSAYRHRICLSRLKLEIHNFRSTLGSFPSICDARQSLLRRLLREKALRSSAKRVQLFIHYIRLTSITLIQSNNGASTRNYSTYNVVKLKTFCAWNNISAAAVFVIKLSRRKATSSTDFGWNFNAVGVGAW